MVNERCHKRGGERYVPYRVQTSGPATNAYSRQGSVPRLMFSLDANEVVTTKEGENPPISRR